MSKMSEGQYLIKKAIIAARRIERYEEKHRNKPHHHGGGHDLSTGERLFTEVVSEAKSGGLKL